MRRSIAGLTSLAVASTVGGAGRARVERRTASAGPPANGGAAVDDLPSLLEDKRRPARRGPDTGHERRGHARRPRCQHHVKVGETAESDLATGRPGRHRDQYVEPRARDHRSNLRDPGRVRHRTASVVSRPGHRPRHSGASPVRGTAAQRDPTARPHGRQLDRLAGGLQNREHYQRLYFGTGRGDESLKQYYEKQSSGRYSVDGIVTDWVKVRYNEARYGRSNGFCGAASARTPGSSSRTR